MTTRPGRRESTYRSLARELRSQILQGMYPDDRRLPTEAELAASHRVSRQTVRRAFQDLVAEGMVYRIPGRGTFAAPKDGTYIRQFGSVEDLMGLSVDTEMELIAPLHRQVDVDAASRLRLDSDSVHTVAFRRFHEQTPFCLTTVYLPPAVGRKLEDVPALTELGEVSTATVIGLLDTRMDTPIAEAEQSVTVALATAEVSRQLGCEEGHPVLRIDRLYRDTMERPIELAISYFLPEHYSYRVRLRRSVT
jgi:GntR family transcriptional regulator